MKFRLFIATAAAVVAVGGGTAGTALASTASPASTARPAAAVSQLDSTRGNVDQIQYNWWGVRIWLDHQGSQAAYQSVAATGHITTVPIPYVPWYIQSPIYFYIHCIGQFVNDVQADDVGYGVVMDVNYWSPWWSCGTLKVWSQ